MALPRKKVWDKPKLRPTEHNVMTASPIFDEIVDFIAAQNPEKVLAFKASEEANNYSTSLKYNFIFYH